MAVSEPVLRVEIHFVKVDLDLDQPPGLALVSRGALVCATRRRGPEGRVSSCGSARLSARVLARRTTRTRSLTITLR
jgi:hypothetical protein